MFASLAKLKDELRFVLITSNATLLELDDAQQGEATEVDNLRVSISAAQGTKCVRCWHIRNDIGVDAAHPELCARCVSNVSGNGEERHYA